MENSAFIKKQKFNSEQTKVLKKYLKNPKVEIPTTVFDWSILSPFEKKVLRSLMKVKAGKTITYAELAKKSGAPGAARAVGSVMRKNPFPVLIPCHRVIRSDGGLGGYAGGLAMKRALLKHEGVKVA